MARGYSNRIAFACLLHDASECYLSDVPRPFKKTLTGYKEQEENLLNLIYQKYLGNLLTSEEEKKVNRNWWRYALVRPDLSSEWKANQTAARGTYYDRL